ncbi:MULTISPECIES: hypothetical protein [unclassified Sphingomonas]|uniref:hypothetical protein n=1 Tax=unclassified Sphingomonas TaxID=196159 RepID=UPI0006F756E9|nr:MULTISPECIES: hypothetical protein [unclassified Sphingomonas]KQX18636.1 hypothetical protein ASD17_16005 [Sphingomonas sp. Root1294]KQY72041.1 hypothetical protein ASD39_18970 [Sphingomonas sp. Root50]KRB94690.1 hypothetical protein ASE22_01785 [Sphingomonas sp. Root720]
MTADDIQLRNRIAARASEISGVARSAIVDEIALDGCSHHATSSLVGAAIDQAIAEYRRAGKGSATTG